MSLDFSECPLCTVCYPYRLSNGLIVSVDITQIDEEYFQVTWLGDDSESRGADFYGKGAEQRAQDYAEFVQDTFARNLPIAINQADGHADEIELLNPPGPKGMF